jgi:para-nitrobenzyl esterase
MPRAAGLFHRAIAQSGAGQHALTPGTAARAGRYLAQGLGVPARREAIAAAPVQQLLDAQAALALDLQTTRDPARWAEITANLMVFEPVIDGDILPALPLDGLRAGEGTDVEVLIGTNTDEQRFFMVPTGAMDYIDDMVLQAAAAAYGLGETALPTYLANRPGASPGDILAAISGDWFFRIPALRVAEARRQSPTWVYEFAWSTPQLGACHYADVAFAFDTLQSEGADWLLGSEPPQILADSMHGAWVAFTRTGDPGWDRYTTQDRATMIFNTRSAIAQDPHGDERRLWDALR